MAGDKEALAGEECDAADGVDDESDLWDRPKVKVEVEPFLPLLDGPILQGRQGVVRRGGARGGKEGRACLQLELVKGVV